jgi:hypothetical protein
MQNTTPNRERLAALIAKREDTMAEITAATDSANKLNVIHDGVEPARQALAAYDSEHAATMARWAKNLVNGRPTTSSAQCETLVRALADAEQTSNAAMVAQSEFQANAERARQPLQRMDLEIRKAAKVVTVEEAAKLLPAIKEAIAVAENLHGRLAAARAEAMSGIEWGSTTTPKSPPRSRASTRSALSLRHGRR